MFSIIPGSSKRNRLIDQSIRNRLIGQSIMTLVASAGLITLTAAPISTMGVLLLELTHKFQASGTLLNVVISIPPGVSFSAGNVLIQRFFVNLLYNDIVVIVCIIEFNTK